MQYKNLFFSGLLLALTLPLQILGYTVSYYNGAPTKSDPGSCGKEYIYDYYVAINAHQFDKDKSGYCGSCIKIVYKDKYVIGRINDRCGDCKYGQVDIAPIMMDQLVGGRANTIDIGIVDGSWSLVSCDGYGKSGSGSSSSSGQKTTTKKTTTTTKKTTTTTKKTTTTTHIITTTTHIISSPSQSSIVQANISTETPVVEVPVNDAPANDAPVNDAPISEAPVKTPVEIVPAVDNNNEPASKEVDEEEKKEEGGSTATYVVPITGAVMISGAAGIGLLYMKRENKYEKVSSQLKSITRSITTRGSSIGRSVTRSLRMGKSKPTPPTLPTTNVANKVIDVTQPNGVMY